MRTRECDIDVARGENGHPGHERNGNADEPEYKAGERADGELCCQHTAAARLEHERRADRLVANSLVVVIRPMSVEGKTAADPAELNTERCASSSASSWTVRDSASTQTPSSVSAAAAASSTATVRVVRIFSNSERN